MSSGMIAFFFGLGVAGWAYSKVSRSTGNANPKNVYLTAGFVGLVAAIVLFTILKFMLHF